MSEENDMEISITLPDEIAHQIGHGWDNIPRRTLEAVITKAFEENLLSGPQVQKILGLDSRFELDAFLKQAGVHLDYGEDDLDADIRTLDELLGS